MARIMSKEEVDALISEFKDKDEEIHENEYVFYPETIDGESYFIIKNNSVLLVKIDKGKIYLKNGEELILDEQQDSGIPYTPFYLKEIYAYEGLKQIKDKIIIDIMEFEKKRAKKITMLDEIKSVIGGNSIYKAIYVKEIEPYEYSISKTTNSTINDTGGLLYIASEESYDKVMNKRKSLQEIEESYDKVMNRRKSLQKIEELYNKEMQEKIDESRN